MEAFALYLLKSVVWISGFTLIYFLFLKDERFFVLKRIYLLSGTVTSILLPLITVHYYVELPSVVNIQTGNSEIAGIQVVKEGSKLNFTTLLYTLYAAGVIIVILRTIMQGRKVIKSIKRSEITATSRIKLIRTASFTNSFSFLSYVFINPSVSDVETREIVNHEMVHIRQKHWADLLLAELLFILQWFNPLTWLYLHFIRQNHEYLADEEALQRSSDPAIYKAVLLNQIVGSPVIGLSNSFSYSLTKKRFNMMKNIITSPYRKLKLLLILPVIAVILIAFAKPEYRYLINSLPEDNSGKSLIIQDKIFRGTVMQKNGTPLSGASVIMKGTTTGTITDSKGNFSISLFPEETPLVISYVGYVSKVVKPDYKSEMKIVMVRDTLTVGITVADIPPPPPPPPPVLNVNGNPPLVVVDGKISNIKIESIDPNSIESISALKEKAAVDKYGDKGKNGVLEITLKKVNQPLKTEPVPAKDPKKEGMYMMVEELPQFPGGTEELYHWILSNIKYPPEAIKKGIEGQVFVVFEVTESGSVKNVGVDKSVNPLLDAEAVRVVSSMPAWKPGSQAGKPVNVFMKVMVVFGLK